MKTFLLVVLVALLAGCAGDPPPQQADPVRDTLDKWLRAATRAWDTRTHATDENPRAQAEADRLEADLRRLDRARVKAAIERAMADPARDKDQRELLSNLLKRIERP